MRGGLVLGDRTSARQRCVVGRRLGVRAKVRTLPYRPSMCSVFTRRHEVIEFD